MGLQSPVRMDDRVFGGILYFFSGFSVSLDHVTTVPVIFCSITGTVDFYFISDLFRKFPANTKKSVRLFLPVTIFTGRDICF